MNDKERKKERISTCIKDSQKLLYSIERKTWVLHMNDKERKKERISTCIKDSQLKRAQQRTGKVKATSII